MWHAYAITKDYLIQQTQDNREDKLGFNLDRKRCKRHNYLSLHSSQKKFK